MICSWSWASRARKGRTNWELGVKSFGIHLWSVLETGFLSCTLSRAQTRKNWRQDPLPLEWTEWKEQTDLPKLYICKNIDNQSKKESFRSTCVFQNLPNISPPSNTLKAQHIPWFSWLVISRISQKNAPKSIQNWSSFVPTSSLLQTTTGSYLLTNNAMWSLKQVTSPITIRALTWWFQLVFTASRGLRFFTQAFIVLTIWHYQKKKNCLSLISSPAIKY